ncbi:MAG: uroporphyrinogen-III synthase [Anaerolineae bacterium]|jgi:uroporphyrinogen-III synthase|nr:uroporphyrinogen-III synthase [Anaerolineae bacterium]
MSLTAKRIVNTRALHQASALDHLLIASGAIPISYPCIAIRSPDDPTAFDQAIASLKDYDYLVFTSVNAVIALSDRLGERVLPPIPIAVIGEATAKAVQERFGRSIQTQPDDYHAEALADHLPIKAGMRILIPESAIARPVLADRLRMRGASVTVVPAYTTICGVGGVDLARQLDAGQIDAITLTSSSTAENLVRRLELEGGERAWLAQVGIVCIGSPTAQTVRALGVRVDRVARVASLNGMIAALEDYFEGKLR